MRDKIVLTRNISEATERVDALNKKPKWSDKLAAFFGAWGLGKTTFIQWIFSNIICFYVRAWAAWSRSPNMMIEDILQAYRVEATGRLKADLRELMLVMKRNNAVLFIDEADRVVGKTLLIETIRDLHDAARVPIVLVGQENLINLLQRKNLGHVFSRVTEVFEFQPLTAFDVQGISAELCDIRCEPTVAEFIRTVTLGDFRLLNVFLTRAEELCRLNGASEITMKTANAAAKALPNPEERVRFLKRGAPRNDSPPFQAAAKNG